MIPVFVWDTDEKDKWAIGAASKWWLHHSLKKFKEKLQKHGSDLLILQGSSSKKLYELAKKVAADSIIWNRTYNPNDAKKIKELQKELQNTSIQAKAMEGALLCKPDFLLKENGTPYLVYTPFWKNFVKKYQPQEIPKPNKIPEFPTTCKSMGCSIDDLKLLPKIKWYENFSEYWQPGEDEALKRCKDFVTNSIKDYKKSRDYPNLKATSKLSPYLHFGEIHPQRIIKIVCDKYGPFDKIADQNIEHYCKEILWREFSYHLLQYHPQTTTKALREEFNNFPWKKNQKFFKAWTKGQTGYPIVDAGMRELWSTGWMHNRVRMIVASFLVKHLNIPWQHGAYWFWDTLVDADLASNTQGWQWTAGCGADAAPYFRIFNPITQGEKFDSEAQYTKHWCPELKGLPTKWIYKPWEAPSTVLSDAGIVLGRDYPKPIVDHQVARLEALANYQKMKK